ncbi:hypothetical protein [Marinicella rhabdoformis]|uniref:hypothetical protein n=1 Tax=Marinicella rhabdoformis TaxID=2580566 RepID=UPI0012AEB42A|nr:hypothetical protein [Marinicella rhabdoformis]
MTRIIHAQQLKNTCQRSSSEDSKWRNEQKNVQDKAKREVKATKAMDKGAIETKSDFFNEDGSAKNIENGYAIGVNGEKIVTCMICADKRGAQFLTPEGEYGADIHGHTPGAGQELPGPVDFPETKPKYYWAPSGALRVVEIVSIDSGKNREFSMQVRTVYGGTTKMNRAVKRWKSGMSKKAILRIEEKGGL